MLSRTKLILCLLLFPMVALAAVGDKFKASSSQFSDPSGREFIKSRTTTTPPSHVTGNAYFVPTGSTGDWSTHIGEFTVSDGSAWLYQTSPPDGFLVWVEDEKIGLECHGANLHLAHRPRFTFNADLLSSPNNADWTVNALAPLAADSNNASLSVRLFDDTTEEGVGFGLRVPKGAMRVNLILISRAKTAPGAARTVGLKWYNRGQPDNAAVESWTSGTVMTDIDIPANEFWQYDEQSIDLSTMTLTAEEYTLFELTRINPAGGTELTGDWVLLLLEAEFY